MASPIGSATGLLVGVGVGGAAARALEPDFQDILQTSWRDNQVRVLDPGILARLVAQGGVDLSAAADEASYSGVNAGRFQDLVYLAQQVPGTAELLFLWRYGKITQAEWQFGMTKLGYRQDFIDAMSQTFSLPLEAGAIATAVHRGIMDGTGLILQEPPTQPGNIPIVPPSTLDPVAQAQALGISHEQLRILVGNTGLPLSLGEMLQLLNRGVVTVDDVKRAVAESNLRNEYMDAAVNLRRRLLTPHDYAELQLRGFQTQAERDAGAALSGMESADAQLLYDMLGRSINVHQITTGIARGGVYNGSSANIPESYLSSLQRGNLRPEYYNLAYANRYTIPSYFVLRALLQAGVITQADGEKYFTQLGWPPDLATAAAAVYATSTGTTADPHIAKAQTQLWGTTHRSYIAEEITDAQATTALEAAGVASGSVAAILTIWQQERDLIRKQLTPAQIKKAVSNGVINPATGAAWTLDEGLAALIQRGYSANDARTFLEL